MMEIEATSPCSPNTSLSLSSVMEKGMLPTKSVTSPFLSCLVTTSPSASCFFLNSSTGNGFTLASGWTVWSRAALWNHTWSQTAHLTLRPCPSSSGSMMYEALHVPHVANFSSTPARSGPPTSPPTPVDVSVAIVELIATEGALGFGGAWRGPAPSSDSLARLGPVHELPHDACRAAGIRPGPAGAWNAPAVDNAPTRARMETR
mmetsp:Transcript_16050/g.40398  ORF Transcript_16050/g.40398 Transcript_16050/m.40398 type:complete len:204 (-) Transcript_16050:31-642(-)